MDDQNFNNPNTAMEWIQQIESDKTNVRDSDLYPLLREWMSENSPIEILDLGAGQGICSDNIDLDGRRYTGLEPSPLLLDRARELYADENRKFVLGNIYQMPFSNSFFDAAFSISVWHLLRDLNQASAELNRVLKENGHFLIVAANPSAYSLWTSQCAKVISHDTLYLYTLEQILDSFKSNGFEISKVEPFRPSVNGQQLFICIQGQKKSDKI